MTGQMKQCSTCKEEKDTSLFSPDSGGRHSFGVRADCKSCRGRAARTYYNRHPERTKESNSKCLSTVMATVGDVVITRAKLNRIRRTYGLTLDQVVELFGSSNVCPLCEATFDNDLHQRHIDHNHVTGEVRGIICRNCNWLLGLAQDNPHVLERAARYLEANRGTLAHRA